MDTGYEPSMSGTLSTLDTCAIASDGSGVVHGRYGTLTSEQVSGIPLEYLSLLHSAAEGAAAVRTFAGNGSGTVLVYGATQASALATVQLASSAGNAVLAVVCGQHSSNEEAVDLVKGFAKRPGTAITEEYAMKKKSFGDLVSAISVGEEVVSDDKEQMIVEFRANVKEYFEKYQVDENLPTIGEEELEENFSSEKYALFKNQFKIRGSQLLRGSVPPGPKFDPPSLLESMLASNESSLLKDHPSVEADAHSEEPYELPVCGSATSIPSLLKEEVGGPVVGAVIAVTPTLATACAAVQKAGKSLRAQAEALQYLTGRQRNAYAAATSVANSAKAAGKEVLTVGGSLPGFKSVEVTDEDVSTALDAMRIEDSNNMSALNFFIQVFRANDFQSYADYAIHKATEPLSGPREKIVTK